MDSLVLTIALAEQLERWPAGSNEGLRSVVFKRGRRSIREAYEERFSSTDGREVTVHRVGNFVERRSPIPRESDRGFRDDQWYNGPQQYPNTREYHDDGCYPPSDRRYMDDSPYFHRNSPFPRNGPYSQHAYNKFDLRHQLGSRNRGRAGPHCRNRGRGSGPPQSLAPERKTKSPHLHPAAAKRDRSPGSRETQPPVCSGSNTSCRSFSPDKDKGYTQAQKKHKPNVLPSHTPSSPVDDSLHSSGSSKEKTPASVGETEEVVAASMEPKLTPEEDFKARRLEAIKAKALEITEVYRRDCETFCTVVKMLVAKEPSLGDLLQSPLDKNLLEIKQRCLEDLRHFVKELDEVIAQWRLEPDCDSPSTSSATHIWTEMGFPLLCSTNTAETDEKQEERNPLGNTEDSSHAPVGDLGGGKQPESTPVSDTCRSGTQENLGSPGLDDKCSKPMKSPSQSTSSPSEKLLIDAHATRMQLYGRHGEKLSNADISNPQMWQNITYIRPGWVPARLPFLPGEQYWEFKANSTVVSTSVPPYVKDQKKDKVACGVTCYMHEEGPWCEVQANNGTRICMLAADAQTSRIPPLLGH